MNHLVTLFEKHVQPYWLRHQAVALWITLILWAITGSRPFAAYVAAGVYVLHELDDYYRLGKRVDGGFDWLGLWAPLALAFFVGGL